MVFGPFLDAFSKADEPGFPIFKNPLISDQNYACVAQRNVFARPRWFAPGFWGAPLYTGRLADMSRARIWPES